MSASINLTIGERIAYFRKQKGLSQDDLSKKLNKARATIAAYEADKIILSPQQIIEIADALEIGVIDLNNPNSINKDNDKKHVPISKLEILDKKVKDQEAEIKNLKRELSDKKLLIEEKNKLLAIYEQNIDHYKKQLEYNQKLYDAILNKAGQ